MLRKLLTALLIFSLTVTASNADPIEVKQNEKAPFTGLLFSQQKAEDIRRELLEKDALSHINRNLRSIIESQQNIETHRVKQLEIQEKDIQRLRRVNDTSNTERVIWFVLGVAVSGAAVYGASSLSK